jgi:hypothetical protein
MASKNGKKYLKDKKNEKTGSQDPQRRKKTKSKLERLEQGVFCKGLTVYSITSVY